VFTVRKLRENTGYQFLVRAENANGLSIPSPMSDLIRTKGGGIAVRGGRRVEPDVIRRHMTEIVARVTKAVAVSSTEIELTYQVTNVRTTFNATNKSLANFKTFFFFCNFFHKINLKNLPSTPVKYLFRLSFWIQNCTVFVILQGIYHMTKKGFLNGLI
jgi:hypothetical protein